MADLQVLRGLLKRRKQLDQDVWNVAKSMFQPGIKVQYQISHRDYFGKVIEVLGFSGVTDVRVRVENLATLKRRDIQLSDITGLVQEN